MPKKRRMMGTPMSYRKMSEQSILSNDGYATTPTDGKFSDDEDNGGFNEDRSPSDSSQFQFTSRSMTASTVEVEDIEAHCSENKHHVSILSDANLEARERLMKKTDYGGLDYDTVENELHIKEEDKMSHKAWRWIQIQRWIVCMIIGILTGITAVVVNICIMQITSLKMGIVKQEINRCVHASCLSIPLLLWILFNVGLVTVASLLTVFLAPVAAGSGIPQIKCFLNGVKIPNVVRLKTFCTKIIGIVVSVSGGLAIGKEGPMVHSGSAIAAGVSQGRSITFRLNTPFGKHFRNDREKRDFVCAGAAAGVSAAFGAPVGGVLFSLEEAASFWNQALTWRIFLASILSSYTLNFFMGIYHGHSGDLAYPGLINFGKFEGSYEGFELPIFFLMGILGGLFGALFNAINYRLTLFRMRMVKSKFLRVAEAAIVAAMSATVAFMMMYINNECKPLDGHTPEEDRLQFMCLDGEYSTMGSLFFGTPEESVKSLFHDPLGAFHPRTLFAFVIPYYFLACWTYGLQVPSGLFIPSLLIGAAWGRAVGEAVNTVFPDEAWAQDMGKYSLMGAAAQLGGTVRMTISLTVILVEATGNITYCLPLMVVLLLAKWTGDYFNEGIYDMHIHLAKVPILEWEPRALSTNIRAREVMNTSVECMHQDTTVEHVCKVLSDPSNNHSGYPVIDKSGKFRGLILRSQLLILLKHKVFVERNAPGQSISLCVFRDSYPRYFPISSINVTSEDMDCTLDLRPFANQAPYTVHEDASFPRIFRIFRALGLRHLVVLNENYKVVGMVTRKDIWQVQHEKIS